MTPSPRSFIARILKPGLLVLLGSAISIVAARAAGVEITEQNDVLRIAVDGKLFTAYCYKGASRPFLYPILGPDDVPMTRNWPMKEVAGEERDHPHHRSLWWTHGDINGHDFWSESAKAGKTVHQKFIEVKSGATEGLIRSLNHLVAADGTLVATADQTLRFHRRTDDRMLDFEITLHASQGPLTFGDTKEGTFGLRLNETLRLVRNKQPGTGHIVNSEGVRDGATWGKRARWVDYYGPVDNRVVGVAIFDHPANPRHPTWWHVRDYGLFAANPFGIHDFEKKPAGTGKLELPAGQSLTFRYRLLFHRGDERAARVAELYEDYARPTPKP